VIDERGFMDLGYEGSKYTWSRHFEMAIQYGRDLIGAWLQTAGSLNFRDLECII